MFRLKTKLFTAAPESALLEWCDEKSATRYVALASAIPRDAFGQAIARLQQGTSAAATTLLKVMIDPGAPASVRVRAADSVVQEPVGLESKLILSEIARSRPRFETTLCHSEFERFGRSNRGTLKSV